MVHATVVSPSHNAKFLREAAWSLAQQTSNDFEWLVMANGAISIEDVLRAVGTTLGNRLRVVKGPADLPPRAGAAKRAAFMQAAGDVLIELDHDDLLAPQAVEKMVGAIDGGADFAYSNVCDFEDGSWKPARVPACRAVTYRPCRIYDRDFYEAVAVPQTPHMFFMAGFGGCRHARAWRREFYHAIGGHSAEFKVHEDTDIAIRSYLGKGRFAHVDLPLYLFRTWAEQTSGKSLTAIPEFDRIYAAKLRQVLKEWARRTGTVGFDDAFTFRAAVDAGKESIAAYIDAKGWADGPFGPPAEVFKKAHRLLVHGGWLLTETQAEYWKPEVFHEATRPVGRERTPRLGIRFQEIQIAQKESEQIQRDQIPNQKPSSIAEPASQEPTALPLTGLRSRGGKLKVVLQPGNTIVKPLPVLSVHMAALKTDEVLGGFNHWTAKADDIIVQDLNAVFSQVGGCCVLDPEEGVVVISPIEPSLANAVEQVVRMVEPTFPGLVRFKPC